MDVIISLITALLTLVPEIKASGIIPIVERALDGDQISDDDLATLDSATAVINSKVEAAVGAVTNAGTAG